MRWQILKHVSDEFEAQSELFDDGIWGQPGESQFTTEHVAAHVAALGDGYSYSWVGTSVVVNPAMEDEIGVGMNALLGLIAASTPVPDGQSLDDHISTIAREHGEDARAAVLRDMGVSEGAS